MVKDDKVTKEIFELQIVVQVPLKTMFMMKNLMKVSDYFTPTKLLYSHKIMRDENYFFLAKPLIHIDGCIMPNHFNNVTIYGWGIPL